jgi:membrane complex biogenesis BtpA family protein
MLHLRPLPGAPIGAVRLADVVEQAIADAQALQAGGVDAILVQNRGDRAFPKDHAAPDVVAAMGIIVHEVVRAVAVPIGVHILRNDTIGSLAVASAAGGRFVRAAVLTGVSHSAQGILEGDPHAILRYRHAIGADDITLFADVVSMHNRVAVQDAPEMASEAVFFGDAGAIIIAHPSVDEAVALVASVRARVEAPILIGGYATHDNIAQLLEHADGAIVGGAFEERARSAGVTVNRVREFMQRVPR